MCGIAGIVSLTGEPLEADQVSAMMSLLIHRGPDDSGLWDGGNVIMGHRRLSVIDLSIRGRNPMSGRNDNARIVLNGEIYNFKDLRSELESEGYIFNSDTDTEVVVNLYDRYGLDCISRLDGMFALAIWDRKKNALIIARDRYGVKPVYWTKIGNNIAFSSEIKSFICLPKFEPRLNPIGLSQYLSFQNMLGSCTLFSGVELLEAGHTLTISRDRISLNKYWDLELDPDFSNSPSERAERVRSVFKAAVKRQLASDVKIGSYLSGGLDTGSIVAVAKNYVSPLDTFTCGFIIPENASGDEVFFDETQEAQSLAYSLGTRHHTLMLDSNSMWSILDKVLWHLDEPRVGISYQSYSISERASRSVKVVMSGVGGDELFAGYPWRYNFADGLETNIFDDVCYQKRSILMNDKQKYQLLSDRMNKELLSYTPKDDFQLILDQSNASNLIDKILYVDFKTFLNGILIVEDKLSMANSVEVRVPFLDNNMVEEARRVPVSWKVNNGVGKVIFRQAMQGLLPNEIITRRKQGFTPPDATWYRGNSLDIIKKILLGKRSVERDIFRSRAVAQIIEDHETGRSNNRFLIWSLLCLEMWHRLFIDGHRSKIAILEN